VYDNCYNGCMIGAEDTKKTVEWEAIHHGCQTDCVCYSDCMVDQNDIAIWDIKNHSCRKNCNEKCFNKCMKDNENVIEIWDARRHVCTTTCSRL